MFGLDPFSSPVAIAEILILLALAAFIGWFLGRLVRGGRVNALRSAIRLKKAELEQCQSEKTQSRSASERIATEPVALASTTLAEDTPEPEPVIETPQFFVSADPLLPAYSHDDTPAPLIAEPVPALDDIEPEAETDSDTFPSIGSALEFPPIEEKLLENEPVVVTATIVETPADDKETIVLNRIAARAAELNFDRIGRAAATEADDLKDIVGVGPFLERKLHSLGIYTYRQIASFSKEDSYQVNEIIEFFPGRIDRDNWVGQAKAFHERKYGRSA